ncbi:hypothetical protein HN014_01290 [Aquimarina sp. TRL1]|uniref:hypothetical protein n=1 Tax=Aquimarina sp. (strain TRL1) TaxID=2736252 RepID=UPI00158BF630|nr:hypothetical protein [Aquimarina sp. TRL1]QKX03602.1 hypothetical protein HN014_01290 [Aquimarina sp. TRL1]
MQTQQLPKQRRFGFISSCDEVREVTIQNNIPDIVINRKIREEELGRFPTGDGKLRRLIEIDPGLFDVIMPETRRRQIL